MRRPLRQKSKRGASVLPPNPATQGETMGREVSKPEQLTKDQAIALYGSGFWKTMSNRDRAIFQIFENRLCMPFDVFHKSIEEALGRPVYTHELGLDRKGLQKELLGERAPPSFTEVIALIPPEKLIVLESA